MKSRTKIVDVAEWQAHSNKEPADPYAFRGHTIGHANHGAMITVWHSRDLRDRLLSLLNNDVMSYVEDPEPKENENDA